MKKSLIVSAVLVLAAFFLLMFGFNAPEETVPETARTLLLVVEKDTGSFLMQLRQGVQTAAAEMGWELITEMVSAAGTVSLPSHGKTPNGALLFIENGAWRQQTTAQLMEMNITPVLVSAEDYCGAGELAGNFAAAYSKVYLLGGDDAQRAAAMEQLENREVLTQLPIDPTLTDVCVAALDEKMTALLGAEKAAGAWTHDLICWNPDEENRIAWLEGGITQAVMLPSPYGMGYEAAMQAMGVGSKAPHNTFSSLVTRDDMYSAQNIKLVFPLLH